jgi:hypothetical protein
MFLATASLLTTVGLPACGTLETYQGPERPDTEVAILTGSWGEYFFYSEQVNITAVDGKRPTGLPWSVSTARLLPGRHWIEFTKEEHYLLGGWNICACVFEFDFAAQHRYKIKANTSSYEVPCWKQQRLERYKGSISMGISSSSAASSSLTVTTVCTGGGLPSFCRQDVDCGPHTNARCRWESDSTFGICESPDR